MPGARPGPTPLYHFYRGAASPILPFAWRSASRKLRAHGFSPERMRERLGHASLPRPKGRLIWFHAASVGESMSVLTLIGRLGERLGDVGFLITSGTPASARLIGERLPPRTRHQFAPFDAAGPVDRFHAHWRADVGIFVESEIWPLMLVRSHAVGTRLALLNARLSARSVRNWRRVPRTARFILDRFDLFLTQNRQTADDLVAMGADPARVTPGADLKATADPLPVDDALLGTMRGVLGVRPVWVASSTHVGEENAVLEVHRQLLGDRPDLCLLLIPRHPERGGEIEGLVERAGLTCARRTRNELPEPGVQVYLADTLGEMGTWYALCPLVFLGGSLTPVGGHNPFEPTRAGAAVIVGPGYFNFPETIASLIAAGGAREVEDASDLAHAVALWLDDEAAFGTARSAARAFAVSGESALDGVIETLCDRLDLV